MRKVCFVTDQCNGVASVGGIGACVRGLSQWLAASGAQVDILIANPGAGASGLEPGAADFVDNVFFLADLVKLDKDIYAPVDEPSKSYHVYRFLRGRDYDEVHFNDWLGTGFYTAMARRQGLFDAAVVTHLHGSSHWVRSYNLNPPVLHDLETETMERSQMENSDLVVAPSQYLIDWLREQGVKLPEAIQRHWILPQWAAPGYAPPDDPLRTRAVAPGEIAEIAFFGRHERRKGFDLFVDAIARLPEDLHPDLTFIGSFERIAREHTGGLALRKLRDYPGRLRFLHDFKQAEALDLLKRSRHMLAVMPSRIENSPCVVGECFTIGVPFLATDVGGTAELIAPDSRAHALAAPDAADLARALERAMRQGLPELISTLRPGEIRQSWGAPIAARPVSKPADKPLVSVCFTHYERPNLLRRAYEAILAQTYENIEIIIVDDGSRSPGAHAYLDEIESTRGRFPVTVIRGPNRYLGAARNAGARAARGEYLLFHDDDNFAEPNEVETFVAAALAYEADVLTAQYYVFHDGERDRDGLKRRIEYYHLGVGGAFSFFKNRFGDANALVKRSVFEELGGFTEDYGVGFEDWEFFLKAYMADKRMGVVPAPLFNYRASATGMLGSGDPALNFERIYRAMEAFRPRLGADILRLANGSQVSDVVVDYTWRRLGRERGSDLLQQLTGVEPNSREAIEKLTSLAIKYGRLSDSLELGAKVWELREQLAGLMGDPTAKRRFRKSFELVVLEPTLDEDVAFLEGWAIDGAGAALDLPAIWAGGRWLPVAGASRLNRPDVKQLLQLETDRDLGFRLLAFAAEERPGAASGGRGLFGRPLGASARKGLSEHKPMRRPAFRIEDFECNLPSGPGWRGHIDRGGWCRGAKLSLPEDVEASAMIEIETSVAAEPAILWSDGRIDWGAKTAPNRARFVCDAANASREFTVIAPSRVRAHVVVN